MKKLLKENKGSTLLTTMFFILVVALLTISFHLALISMIDKVTDSYDQQQAYVSARGIATAIAESFEESSAAEYATYTSSASSTPESGDVILSDEWLNLLNDIQYVDDSINLTDITVGGVVLGDNVTGTITKTAEYFEDGATMGTATYLLTITTTYGDEVESVSLTINRAVSKVTVADVTTEEVEITGGYLQGFYYDVMPTTSRVTYAEDNIEQDDAIFVCQSSVIYTDPDMYFAMKSDFYCAGDVVLVGGQKNINGEDLYEEYEKLGNARNLQFYAEGDIYLQDLSAIKYVDIQSEGDVYIYMTENARKLQNVTITCDNLYLLGASSSNTLSFDSSTCEIYANDVIMDTKNTVDFNSTTISIGKSSTGNNKATHSTSDFTTAGLESTSYVSYNKGDQTPDVTIPARYIAPFSEAATKLTSTVITSSSAAIEFTATTTGTADAISYSVYELSSESGVTNYYFNSSQFKSGYSDTNPIVVYVPNGVTVTITGRISSSGVCFYLEDSANLIFERASGELVTDGIDDQTYVRIYSDALDDGVLTNLESAFTTAIGGTIYNKLYTKDLSEAELKEIQTAVYGAIDTVEASYANFTLPNGTEVVGTIVINTMQSASTTDYSYGLEVEYNYSADLASQTVSREAWYYGTVDYYTFSVGIYNE